MKLFRLPSLLLLLLLLAAQQATCSSSSFNSSRPHRGRVLALLPHPSQRFSRFSHLFSSIEARGYEVVARSADDPGLRLREWDSWLWDKVVVIPEEKGKEVFSCGSGAWRRERERKRRRGLMGKRDRFFRQSNAFAERGGGNLDLFLAFDQRPTSPRSPRRAAFLSQLFSREPSSAPPSLKILSREKQKTSKKKTSAAPSTPVPSSSSSPRAETSSSRSRPRPPRTSAPSPRPWVRTRSPRGAPS